MPDRVEWELAGVTDLNGELDRPLKSGHVLWIPEEIELEGDEIVWRFLPAKQRAPGHGLLGQFLELSHPDAPLAGFLRFARRWGIFGLCEHGQPPGHRTSPRTVPCLWCHHDQLRYWEPISRWRAIAAQARSMLNIAAAIHQGKTGQAEDWKVVGWRFPEDPWTGIEHARHELALAVQNWLDLGRVHLSFQWDRSGWSTSVSAQTVPGLYGALGCQLMLAIARTAWAICSECGLSYTPPRRPDPNRDNFCPRCGRKTAVRRASMRYRQRKRKETP